MPAWLLAGLRPAIEATAAIAITVGVLGLARQPAGAVVLGAVLAMTLSRSRLNARWRARAEAAVVLPLVGLGVAGVGILLLEAPIVGAAAYALVMAASVWMRRFGPVFSRVGGMVALPFVTLLIGGGLARGVGVLGVVLVSLLALAAAVVVRVIADAVGGRRTATEAVAQPSSLRPVASTRMAIQLGLAIAVAFAVGFAFFGDHWGWVVLTAYLVQSGNRGRADVLLKSGLRVLGAAGGTLLVALLLPHVSLTGPWLAIVPIVLLSVGLVARAASYAWWAFAMTIVLSVLQSAFTDVPLDPWLRVLAIVVGALLGVASAWFVLPVRSIGVLRRRLADALAALAERAAGEPSDVDAAMARLNEVAEPFLITRALPRRGAPGRWVLLVREAVALLPDGPAGAPVRRAIAASRAALRDRDDLGGPLTRLRDAAAEGS